MSHQTFLNHQSATRRPITSCLECYRRKQKCNKKKPCNHCYARKLPEKCYFSHELYKPNDISISPPILGSEVAAEAQDSKLELEATSVPSTLVQRAGYSGVLFSCPLLQFNNENVREIDPSNPTLPNKSQLSHRNAYLNLVARLPPHDIIKSLLYSCFHDLYWAFTVVDEHHLLNLYDKWRSQPIHEHLDEAQDAPQRELRYFPALLFQILSQVLHGLSPDHAAIAALGLSEFSHCDRLSQTYHLIGDQLVHLLGRHHPTICSVEHDLVSACWLKNSGRGTESWYRLGSSIRQAQELGMHNLPQTIEQSSNDSIETNLLKIWDLEHRKRVWARLFILDSTFALSLGRPRLVHREDVSTSAPLNCDYPREPAKTVPIHNEKSQYTLMSLMIDLAHKKHDMLSCTANGTLKRDYGKVLSLHNDLCSLRQKLQFSLQEAPPGSSNDREAHRVDIMRLLTLNHFNCILIALHRPFIRTHVSSREAAVNAALELLEEQRSILEIIPFPQSRVYGNAFYTIDASIFLCGVMVELPLTDPVQQRQISNAILQSIGVLAAMKSRSPLAESGEQILLHFYQKIQLNRRQGSVLDYWSEKEAHQPQFTKYTRAIDYAIPPPQQQGYEIYQSLFSDTPSWGDYVDQVYDPTLNLTEQLPMDYATHADLLQHTDSYDSI